MGSNPDFLHESRIRFIGNWANQTFLDLATVLIAYLFIGYAIAYGMQYLFGALSADGINSGSYAHYMKMVMFVVAERIKISGYVICAILIGAIVYPIFEGLAWGSLFCAFIAKLGYHDFAGSGVVHIMGGLLGLTAAWILGSRKGRYKDGKPIPIPGHDTTYVVLGAFILAFGWYGFNIGSAAFIDPAGANIASVAVATTMAMAGGILAAAVVTKGDPVWCSNGMCAGLVAICAGADLLTPVKALLVGIIAGIQTPFFFKFLEERGIDDTCGVTPVHAISGLWGVIAVGILDPRFLIGQLIGVITVSIIAVVSGIAIYGSLKALNLLRVDEEVEEVGLDESLYEMNVYPEVPIGSGESS